MKIQDRCFIPIQRKNKQYQVNTSSQNKSQQVDTFTKSLYQEYVNYTKELQSSKVQERKTVGLTEEQFEAMVKGELGEVQTDGKSYWMVIEGILYEFKKISKDEDEKEKGTYDILLDTVEECLERVQEELDETFYKWTMKEDILYPNKGKNALITLGDILKKREEKYIYKEKGGLDDVSSKKRRNELYPTFF